MKTLKQFEKQGELSYDEFLKPMDRIDEEFFHHILCGYVPSNYTDRDDKHNVCYGQAGEAIREDEYGTLFYSTVISVGDKYWYLGEMPSMNKGVYRCEECHNYI